ncbi:UNVERIFIED_CONTAM: hypothetical protein Sradi_5159100 [Sesamum radiatum]|uniref:Uncharacterized protein n=1 Tax=Sesamum radiatum TaxID=300843 RepID=A0AAW2M5R6_SESRA
MGRLSVCVLPALPLTVQRIATRGRGTPLLLMLPAVTGASNVAQCLSRRSDREQICSTSEQINPVTVVQTGIPSTKNTVMTPMQRMELQYKNLIENWIPPQWQDASLDSDDQDWLFQGKNEDKRAEKRQKAGNDSLPCSSSSASWAHAQYLQDVDVYALPFTVPF